MATKPPKKSAVKSRAAKPSTNTRSTSKRKTAKPTRAKSKTRSARKPSKKLSTKQKIIRWCKRALLILIAIGLICLAGYTAYLDRIVVNKFEGKRFALPATVYAQPIELYKSGLINRRTLLKNLRSLGYEESAELNRSGQFYTSGNSVDIFVRPFIFWDGLQPETKVHIEIENDQIVGFRAVSQPNKPHAIQPGSSEDSTTNLGEFDRGIPSESAAINPSSTQANRITMVRLEPLKIGGIYPAKGEDRELVRLEQVPKHLINALLAVEDKRFYSHKGVDPKAVLRAVVSLFKGGKVQGGSTLTQQLVKNFYLTRDRTLQRKAKEMIMALLLELHYSKNEILETYINEVYFGQDKNRAIHGFGLASRFFFARPLEQLRVEEAALLVGMLKGPIYYNPRNHPRRAQKRRDLALQLMFNQGFLREDQFQNAQAVTLRVSPKPGRGQSLHPAFMDLVIRQLKRDYKQADLQSEGLLIFTTLDPEIQRKAEAALSKGVDKLERYYGITPKTLEGAAVVADVLHGEVKALVGGRVPDFQGFNRALDASRQVGSLLKPAIYLTALEQPDTYNLASVLDDSPFSWSEPGISDWQPQNYDRKYHGDVPLWKALAKSYNVSAARLGTELGVAKIMRTVKRLGINKTLPPYASSLLGATELTPLEITQVYHTLAAAGFRSPLRAIREVTSKDGIPMNRYELAIEQVIEPVPAYLIVKGMETVVSQGTGAALKNILPRGFSVAGKTGTTDGLRDSWFSGFSGDQVATVWVGNDDNKPIGLTGATGALKIWGDIMADISLQEIDLNTPEGVSYLRLSSDTGFIATKNCTRSFKLPFDTTALPPEAGDCDKLGNTKKKSWFKRILGL